MFSARESIVHLKSYLTKNKNKIVSSYESRLITISKSNFNLTLARQLLTTANYRCYFESLGQNGRVYTLKVHIGRGIDFKVLEMSLQILLTINNVW